MTFTSSQMAQARYTTRNATLDTFTDLAERVHDAAVTILNAPADGLSIGEAHTFYARAMSIERQAQALRSDIYITRGVE